MRIYLSGIGGVGIGPLAEIALDAGYDVLGSDPVAGLMTRELQKRGVEISTDQSGDFLRTQHETTPIDWFVYTSALPADHPELVLARSLGIRTAKRDELLAHIIDEKQLKLIAIAGTHGKTTTTNMMAWVFECLGVPISYSIGTTLSWGPSGRYDPASKYFVYECDEFDRNFLHFHPYLSLITTIEHDHPDTYPTEAKYYEAFSQFAAQSQHVITWKNEVTHITLPKTSWVLGDDEVADIHDIMLAGEHNRRNATLVSKGIEYLQSHDESIRTDENINKILNRSGGISRRFERLADNLYTDYGHHPTEIKATLQLAREWSDHVVLVYQPHQNVRQHEIRDQYTDAIFADAEDVYWLPTYLSRENPELEILSPEELTKNLDQSKTHFAEMNDDLWHTIQNHREAGYLVLCMGAGPIDGWVRRQLRK